jgi:hypothetical protein
MSRLLCSVCGDLKLAVMRSDENIVLSCGHSRTGALPSKPGCVSVEHLAGRQSATDRKRLADLYPFVDTHLESTSRPEFVEYRSAN